MNSVVMGLKALKQLNTSLLVAQKKQSYISLEVGFQVVFLGGSTPKNHGVLGGMYPGL